MKRVVALLGILGLYGQMDAEDFLQGSASKSEMLLDAKHLFYKQKMLQNKKAAWQKRLVGLIEDFNQKVETTEQFGDNNRYGLQRQERRERDFYSSLQAQSDEIEKNLREVKSALARLKQRFSYLYARPLTKEEIEGKKVPKIAQKKQKIELLEAYIASQRSWKRCLKRNESFDKQRVEIENSAVINEKKYQYLSEHLDQKVRSNVLATNEYRQKAQSISQEYMALTGSQLKDVQTAKIILKHIKESN